MQLQSMMQFFRTVETPSVHAHPKQRKQAPAAMVKTTMLGSEAGYGEFDEKHFVQF